MRERVRQVRAVALVSALLAGLSVSPAAAQQPPAAPASDVRVGIILGNAPVAVDEPTTAQTARCLKAFELFKNGVVNTLLVTGGFTLDYMSEARMMKIALATYGVPPESVLEDELASTTVENALFASKMFDERKWPKTAWIISQAYHLPRAAGNFKTYGFQQVQEVASADAAGAAEDFALVPGLAGEPEVKPDPADLIVVYEPFRGIDPMPWPTPQLAHRLRAAAALYHRKAASSILLYNDRYTRGPVNLAHMMKIALVSLGVPAANITAVRKTEFRFLRAFEDAYKDKVVTMITSSAASAVLSASNTPKWKVVFID